MFVPIFSPLGQRLYPRKGGGGKGGGKSSSSGKTSSSSKGSTSSTKGSPSTTKSSSSRKSPLSISGTGSKKKSASPYGSGSSKVSTIPSGQFFAGRTQGGGTRDSVFGSRTYGSGYPGLYGHRGVGGLGFPFYFWPVVWGTGFGYGNHYLHDSSNEYGRPDNSSRPGGSMSEATFTSATMNSTFHILADNTTVISLVSTVTANCSAQLNTSSSTSPSSTPWPFNSSDPWSPRPEQAVQYYRASSVVLTLEGYNNSAALSDDINQADDAIPSWTDFNLLYCLNQTIGVSVPLIDGATWTSPSMSLLLFIWVVLCSFLAF